MKIIAYIKFNHGVNLGDTDNTTEIWMHSILTFIGQRLFVVDRSYSWMVLINPATNPLGKPFTFVLNNPFGSHITLSPKYLQMYKMQYRTTQVGQ